MLAGCRREGAPAVRYDQGAAQVSAEQAACSTQVPAPARALHTAGMSFASQAMRRTVAADSCPPSSRVAHRATGSGAELVVVQGHHDLRPVPTAAPSPSTIRQPAPSRAERAGDPESLRSCAAGSASANSDSPFRRILRDTTGIKLKRFGFRGYTPACSYSSHTGTSGRPRSVRARSVSSWMMVVLARV